MRPWRWLVLLLALAWLPGCAGTETDPAADGTAPPPAVAAAQPAAVSGEDLSAARTEARARTLTEEEVLAAYDRAITAYGWFELSPLPSSGAVREVDGVPYRRVDAPGLTDLGELRGYLRTLFSQPVIDRLLDTGLYTEIDGALYVGEGGRSRDPSIGWVETRVQQDGDTRYFVNVSAEILDTDLTTVTGMEFSSFPYELWEDRWVFTDFRLPY